MENTRFKKFQIVVITKSFLGIPNPCFGYIYEQYNIGGGGFAILAFSDKILEISSNNFMDLGGFSYYECDEYLIPYEMSDVEFNFDGVSLSLSLYESVKNGSLNELFMKYDNNLLIKAFRDISVDRVLNR